VVYATVALNKSAESLLNGFERAVAGFGYPLRVRADMALEGQGIGQRMLGVRGAGAYLTGPSTANQVLLSIMVSWHVIHLVLVQWPD
jgi:hypothetical protein